MLVGSTFLFGRLNYICGPGAQPVLHGVLWSQDTNLVEVVVQVQICLHSRELLQWHNFMVIDNNIKTIPFHIQSNLHNQEVKKIDTVYNT